MDYKDLFNDADRTGADLRQPGDETAPDAIAPESERAAATPEPERTAATLETERAAIAPEPWRTAIAEAEHAATAETERTAAVSEPWRTAASQEAERAAAMPEPALEAARPRIYGKVSGRDAAPTPDEQGMSYTHYRVDGSTQRPEPRPLGVGQSGAWQRGSFDGGHLYGAPASAGAAPNAPVKPPFVDRRRFFILVVVIIVAMIASGVIGVFIGSNMGRGAAAPGSTAGTDIKITPNSDIGTTEAVAQKVLDSVVGITSTTTSSGGYFGFGSQESGGVGTGIIVDAAGYILTNSHVVLDGEVEKLEILLSDGSTASGKLLWNDSALDLAVVKVDATGKTLKPAELGDSDNVRIGSYVAAIGNPLGLDFNGSITQGVVSGLDRSITASDGTSVTTMDGLIQVDAAINSGNSGGPLLDSEGKVIGVNTAKAQAEGMGFAIPINIAKPIVDKVISTGSFERVYMGVSAADASTIAEQYPTLGLESGVKGAFITAVSGDSPADNAGLKMKDIIISVDGKDIGTSGDLIKSLLNYSVGDTAKIVYLRDGKKATAEVKLADQSEVYGEWSDEQQGGSSEYGDGGGYPADPFGDSDPFANPFGTE